MNWLLLLLVYWKTDYVLIHDWCLYFLSGTQLVHHYSYLSTTNIDTVILSEFVVFFA